MAEVPANARGGLHAVTSVQHRGGSFTESRIEDTIAWAGGGVEGLAEIVGEGTAAVMVRGPGLDLDGAVWQ